MSSGYEALPMDAVLDKVVKGDRTIAWINREEKSRPEGGGAGFPPPRTVYAVYRARPSGDAFGERVGERYTHHGAFELAVVRCG